MQCTNAVAYMKRNAEYCTVLLKYILTSITCLQIIRQIIMNNLVQAGFEQCKTHYDALYLGEQVQCT